jgi:hypothetical protein
VPFVAAQTVTGVVTVRDVNSPWTTTMRTGRSEVSYAITAIGV